MNGLQDERMRNGRMNLSLSMLGDDFDVHSARNEVPDPDASRVRGGKSAMGAST